jgi:hypothetical protein
LPRVQATQWLNLLALVMWILLKQWKSTNHVTRTPIKLQNDKMGLKIAQEPKTAKVKNLMPKVG